MREVSALIERRPWQPKGVVADDDWRLQGQEPHLAGAPLRWRVWSSERSADSDHDHCEFCWVHFADHVLADDPDTQLAGFTTEDAYRWICRRCFDDFAERFDWTVEGNMPDG